MELGLKGVLGEGSWLMWGTRFPKPNFTHNRGVHHRWSFPLQNTKSNAPATERQKRLTGLTETLGTGLQEAGWHYVCSCSGRFLHTLVSKNFIVTGNMSGRHLHSCYRAGSQTDGRLVLCCRLACSGNNVHFLPPKTRARAAGAGWRAGQPCKTAYWNHIVCIQLGFLFIFITFIF